MPIKISVNKSLKDFTTFKIGGFAKYFTVVKNQKEAISALRFAKKYQLNIHLVGRGSNSIFDDRGFNGLVIFNEIDFCHFHQNLVHVGSGYSFSHLGIKTAKKKLSGLEFASAIPASVGGAIFMNAGANSAETFDCLKAVSYLYEDGSVVIYKKDDLKYGYRHSIFQKKKGLILDAIFELKENEKARANQLNLLSKRIKTQPYNKPSAGCIFRNPTQEISAAFLIDQCGLKGKRIGDACVSEKHANFIVNEGNATAKDVSKLIQHIQAVVKKESGYDIQLEARFIPYE